MTQLLLLDAQEDGDWPDAHHILGAKLMEVQESLKDNAKLYTQAMENVEKMLM